MAIVGFRNKWQRNTSGGAVCWRRVPLVDIAALGLETAISSCSFFDGRYAYLEEDAANASLPDQRQIDS